MGRNGLSTYPLLGRPILKWHRTLRRRSAQYAEQIAATLGRAPFRPWRRTRPTPAGREAVRELGRIAGYVEDIVRAWNHLDGRKLAGVKRRWSLAEPMRAAAGRCPALERLLEAEATSGRWPTDCGPDAGMEAWTSSPP